MPSLSSAKRSQILQLLDSGQSAHQIMSATGAHVSTISRLRQKHRPSLPKSCGGRPSLLSSADTRYAIHLITSRKAENAVQISRIMSAAAGHSISSKTVRRKLSHAGMKAVVKAKRPLLTASHRAQHLNWALAHEDWTLEDWKRVVWSDEIKINHLGSDGRTWVWKKAGEGLSDRLVKGTLKYGGGSMMVWGCTLWEGYGYACKIEGKMDAELYTGILDDHLLESLTHYDKDPEDIVFQQDNDPKHTSKKARTWFEDNQMEVLQWPAHSSDLNPIEHLW